VAGGDWITPWRDKALNARAVLPEYFPHSAGLAKCGAACADNVVTS
jgi:hypothetical protein